MYTHTNKDAQILSTQGVNGNFIRGASFTIYVFYNFNRHVLE